ncbi:unnamed protein product [Rotaria magnacalcarata]|uniref:Uncharacterized protein n=3 Tax=Rotaria magnacalcarata TaxID=392030 RepID=A0A819SF15_9BILA|nr:unnamed protein product [Rotaria magnacalcarata]CAF4069233.1 unnamed protein product [Rotaria magnacalcarata]
MINSNENNKSTINDDSCIVVTRPMLDQQGISILQTTQIHNCSKPTHVLCKSKTKLAAPLHPVCLEKPLTLGLPAMISNYLTHELCLSVCNELKVNLAVLQMNKCYCLKSFLTHLSKIISPHEKYRKEHCGLNHLNYASKFDYIFVGKHFLGIILRPFDRLKDSLF